MGNLSFQARYKAQQARAEEIPEAFAMAMAAINDWGSERLALAHAIAEAIAHAYELGRVGRDLPTPPKPVPSETQEARPTRISRTRPAPAPQTARTVRISRNR